MTIADEISRLEELRDSGSLTDEEFAEAKRQVLADGGTATWVDGSGQIFGVDETTWCWLMHASQLVTWSGIGLIAPVVMWAVSKDRSEIARRHGARMMNWFISSFIYLTAGGVLCSTLIGLPVGIPILIVIGILCVAFPIMAAVKCYNGEIWSYPLAIRFLDED